MRIAAVTVAVSPDAQSKRSRNTTQRWVVFLDRFDWASGDTATVTAAIRINVLQIYDKISVVSGKGFANLTFGQLLLAILGVVGGLFLIIQFVALVIGFVLARQI